MINLVGTFLNSEGKKHSLNIKNPDTEKSPEEIKEAFELLSSLDIFEKDGIDLFQEVVSAKYVETIETPIFMEDEFFGEPNKPIALNQSTLLLAWQEPATDLANEEVLVNCPAHVALPIAKQQTALIEKDTKELKPELQSGAASLDTPRKPPNTIKKLISRRFTRKPILQQQKNPPDPPIP